MNIYYSKKETGDYGGWADVSNEEAAKVIARFYIDSDDSLIPTALKGSKEGKEEMVDILAHFLIVCNVVLDCFWDCEHDLDKRLKDHFGDDVIRGAIPLEVDEEDDFI